MEQSKALSKPDFRHILADINWEHGSHLVLAAKRSDSQGLLLKSVPFPYDQLNRRRRSPCCHKKGNGKVEPHTSSRSKGY